MTTAWQRLLHVPAVATTLLAALLAGACPTPALAGDATPLERAIMASDVDALRQALAQATPSDTDTARPRPLLMRAITRLDAAPPAAREPARDIIRVFVAQARVPLAEPFQSVFGGPIGMPTTWIARIAGERDFALELVGIAPVESRCALLADMAKDGHDGQWENATAGLALVPAPQRASPACRALFEVAVPHVQGGRIELLDVLFSAGLRPAPAQAVALLQALPAQDAAKPLLARLVAQTPLDAPLDHVAHWTQTPQPPTLFAFLLKVSLQRIGSPLQAMLAETPAWQAALSAHAPHPQACTGENVTEAAGAWRYTVPPDLFAGPATPDPVRIQRQAATRWLVTHCDATRIAALPWPQIIGQGGGDLAALALARHVPLADPVAAFEAAACAGDAELSLRVLEQVAPDQALARYLGCLPPLEDEASPAAPRAVLSALLARGADPEAPLAGATPLAIAAAFDRDDVARVLRQAGATGQAMSGEAGEFWLARRLFMAAGIATPSLPFQEEAGAEAWRSPTEVLHLDGSGIPQYAIWESCGGVNCEMAVLRRAGKRWQVILQEAGGLEVLATRHEGWLDLRVHVRAAAAQYRHTLYRHDGTGYRAAVCEETDYSAGDGEPVIREIACEAPWAGE